MMVETRGRFSEERKKQIKVQGYSELEGEHPPDGNSHTRGVVATQNDNITSAMLKG
jgi:hypothetical protein